MLKIEAESVCLQFLLIQDMMICIQNTFYVFNFYNKTQNHYCLLMPSSTITKEPRSKLSLLMVFILLIDCTVQESILPMIETNNQYQKYYRSLVTAQNTRLIENFNDDQAHPFKLKQNKFISMKNEEFHNLYTTSVKMNQNQIIVNPIAQNSQRRDKSTPKGVSMSSKISYEVAGCDSINVDWTIHASSVKDQGMCNSCYAHSTLASVQTMLHVEYGIKYDLSEQHITDCTINWAPKGYEMFNNFGCDGGWGWKSLVYIQLNGVVLQQNRPYTAGKDKITKTCNQTAIVGKRFKVSGSQKYYDAIWPQSQCNILNQRLLEGKTIAVSIWVPLGFQFQFYGSQTPAIDIYNMCGNYKGVNHELLLVGSTDRYWKLKNSFGLEWGQKGYLYLDKSKGLNCLNICMDFSFPTGLLAGSN